MINAIATSKTMTRMIDVHHHIVPDEYVRALSRRGITKALGVLLPKWSLNTALEVLEGHDIATAIISISAPSVYFGEIDEPLAFA